jgi:prepilin peptidase CpaA
MNLVSLAPQWALLALGGLLLLAALQDAVQLKISNLLCAAILLLGILSLFLVGIRPSVWQNALLVVVALTVGTMMHSAGKLGGGDVKLFAGTVFWFDLSSALWLLASVTIAGGILALLILGARMASWSEAMQQRVIILRPRSGIPYGIAIAVGALLTVSFNGSQQAPDPRTNWNAVTGLPPR